MMRKQWGWILPKPSPKLLFLMAIPIKHLARLLTLSFPLWALLGGLIGYARPDTFQFILPNIKLALGVIMFGMGATLSTAEIRRVIEQPRVVGIGVATQFILMPLIAWALVTLFGFGPGLAVGFILLGACPGGTASNVIAYLAKADVALSVTMTTASTLLAPLLTPLIVWLLAGAWMQIDVVPLFWSITQIVLVPVTIGVLARKYFGKLLDRFLDILPLISIVVIVLIVGAVIGKSSATIASVGLLVLLVVALHNGLGLALGYGVGKLTRLELPQRRTLAIEVGMQNSGLAAALAVAHFSPEAAVPAALFSAWHNLTGPALAAWWSRKP